MTVYAKMCLDMMDCAGRPKIVVLREPVMAKGLAKVRDGNREWGANHGIGKRGAGGQGA